MMANNFTKLNDMISRHAVGMKHLKLSLAIIKDSHVTKIIHDGSTWRCEVPHYIYEIGSVTKTFTASLLAKLLYAGRIHLEDTVEMYLPELSECPHCPTILQLATHTSGLGNDINRSTADAEQDLATRMTSFSGDYESDCVYRYLSEEDIIDQVCMLDHNARYGFRYSNIGYALLGIVLGRAGGVSYETLMMDLIRKDLHLQETWLGKPAKGCVLQGVGQDDSSKGNWLWDGSGAKAAGAIYSTLDDMVSYLKRHMVNQPEWLQQTHQQTYAACAPHEFSIGLGWIKEGNITWHNGSTGCFRSFVGFREDVPRGVVLLENCRERNHVTVDTIGKYLLQE